jgi:hypothetical protein
MVKWGVGNPRVTRKTWSGAGRGVKSSATRGKGTGDGETIVFGSWELAGTGVAVGVGVGEGKTRLTPERVVLTPAVKEMW